MAPETGVMAPDATELVRSVVRVRTGSGTARAEWRIGVSSTPSLADHRLEDMTVVPGSVFVEMALHLERERAGRLPSIVRNVSFQRPVILSGEDTPITIDVRERGDCVELTFHEADITTDASNRPASGYVATLEIDGRASPARSAEAASVSVEAFQAQSHVVADADRFYGKLRANGNQYGPAFQTIRSIWRAGDEALASVHAPYPGPTCGLGALPPVLLDAMTQVLAVFLVDEGKPFVLRSIGELRLTRHDLPEALWVHARLQQRGAGEGKDYVGDVRLLDASGEPYVELSRVALTQLDRAADEAPAMNMVVAANFTAEPLEDSLAFWAKHFTVPLDLEFAPYNQVFQQLLEPGSALRKNRDGVNAILLELGGWAATGRRVPQALKPSWADGPRSRKRCVLPNGLEIAHLNQYETDYLYKEIFEDRCYLKHGIRLRDGDTVVDIGANIGMFSLFVLANCANARVFALEPAPVVYDLLRANADAYGSNLRALNLGAADKPGSATLTFYEESSVFSGFHPDDAEDLSAVQAVVRNMLRGSTPAGGSIERYVQELTAGRLRRTSQECAMTSVSALMREQGIDRVNLLKIDAEKSELAIVRGIDEGDWAKIDQIVIEVHDRSQQAVRQIERMLAEKGYRCAVECEALLEDSGLYNVYATRLEDRPAGAGRSSDGTANLRRTVDDFCGALESFAGQSPTPLVVCVCPRRPVAGGEAGLEAALDKAERELLAAVRRLPNVHGIGSDVPVQRYSVASYYDARSDHAGHVPYTPECYAAIGTELFRTVHRVKRRPFKAIVLDCDNTLWRGVCGEDGPLGVDVSGPFHTLQQFMVDRMNAGMLLCLCSKNEESDVLAVFERRADMALKWEHLVAWRVNWDQKSSNLRALADELDLGLDSFIFIDDNPLECADVRINCPGVLVLQLPGDSAAIPGFLKHVWAFDDGGRTAEDRDRTRMYQENTRRQRFREQQGSLADFIKGLELRIDIAEAAPDDLPRVSQLTFRTNQFNCTTVRRSESEIREFVERKDATCLVVRVADRFGDYGLVGVVLYETRADRLAVDTLLLSCRVLGRGVEHALVAELGRRASREGRKFVQLAYRATAKNQPVVRFLADLGISDVSEQAASWALEASRLAMLEYRPDVRGEGRDEAAPADSAARAGTAQPRSEGGLPTEPLAQVAERWREIGPLMKAIETCRLGAEAVGNLANAPFEQSLQGALLSIWRRVLGRPGIGPNDNFFEVGGTSLKAVRVVSTIAHELKHEVSIVTLFECPTVNLLANKLSPPAHTAERAARPTAAERGARRRNALRRGGS
jgi:FkbH-like protein/FkbM family methyltransferase